MLSLDQFIKEFQEDVSSREITWEAIGFYGVDKRIYPFGTDTKVLSAVFEAFCAPVVCSIAAKHGYDVTRPKQTVYPDFTLTPQGQGAHRIAIDVKTTYRATKSSSFRFTLGSYMSFLRNETKNICFPYMEYSDHWVIGFVYQRKEGVAAKVTPVDGSELPPCPYENVDYFIQEKYKIAGKTPASGNTTNIGSFPTANIEDLRSGKGPFASEGMAAFEKYWREYEK